MSENDIPLNEVNYSKDDTRKSFEIKEPNFDYLNQIQITNYFFLTHKNVPLIFYIFTIFSIILLIFITIIFKFKVVFIIIILLSIAFYIISIFPYGINVKLNKDKKTIEMEKKCMIQKFSFFQNNEYSLFDIQEFMLLKKEINQILSGLKINLVLMSGRTITLYEEWVLKEDESEIVEKTKRLNEFINKI